MTHPQHLTEVLNCLFSASTLCRSSLEKSGCERKRCHASTGVISPSRLMLLLRCRSSLMIAPLAVHFAFGFSFGLDGARAIKGVDACCEWGSAKTSLDIVAHVEVHKTIESSICCSRMHKDKEETYHHYVVCRIMASLVSRVGNVSHARMLKSQYKFDGRLYCVSDRRRSYTQWRRIR